MFRRFPLRTLAVLFITGLIMVVGVVSTASALELSEAKAQRLVGETYTGYLAATSDRPSREVAALVEDINSRRREEYSRIAQQNKTEIAAVEALAGRKAIDRTPAGQMVQRHPGQWATK